MQVYVGADYRGYNTKQDLLKHLAKTDHTVVDLGTYDDSENDFNDSAIAVAKRVRKDMNARGILICDSAHGMTMQANRFKGVRAAHCSTPESAQLAREHDDANILCLSAHFLKAPELYNIVDTFLDTKFEHLERRSRRINRLDEREDYD